MYEWIAKARMIAHVQDNLNLHSLHTFEDTFLLDVAHVNSLT